MKNDSMTPEVLENRLVDFAVRIGKVADALPDTRLGQHIANQIVRSGTSPAPNYSEGCASESRKDFAHKLSISLKELRETKRGFALSERRICFPLSDFMPSPMRPISSVRSCHAPSIPRGRNSSRNESCDSSHATEESVLTLSFRSQSAFFST